ncbi:MAG TPA: alpha/beta family hydrolase [Methylomirabilota bacterium]|nr:alpha/beta family hydrolase [Methylomirabilota bacterium]
MTGARLIDRADAGGIATLVLAHGAGGPMDGATMSAAASAIAEAGVTVVRFEFGYMAGRREGKRRPPPRIPAIVPEFAAVLAAVLSDTEGPVLIGGKSMGSRVASRLAATDIDPRVRGVVALGFPFHPPGSPDRSRLDDLAASALPVLVCQGTRDPFGSRDEVAAMALPTAVTVAWLEDGNHDLAPRVSSGFTRSGHLAAAAKAVAAFAEAHCRSM